MVVLISGVSLAGYVALRFDGQRYGVALLGEFGGLASSRQYTDGDWPGNHDQHRLQIGACIFYRWPAAAKALRCGRRLGATAFGKMIFRSANSQTSQN